MVNRKPDFIVAPAGSRFRRVVNVVYHATERTAKPSVDPDLVAHLDELACLVAKDDHGGAVPARPSNKARLARNPEVLVSCNAR